MSWSPPNCYNITLQRPLAERNLNIFQIEWKSKTLCRLYYNGDVTNTVFKRTLNDNHRNMYETLGAMERRLDNVLFRSMFASSVFQARKMVAEGRVLVNGRRVRFADCRMEDGDMLQVSPKWSQRVYRLAEHPLVRLWGFVPAYLEVSFASLTAVFLRKPELHEIPSPYPAAMVDNMAMFYSKR